MISMEEVQSDEKTDLAPYLRPADLQELARVLKGIVSDKPKQHDISPDGYTHKNFKMSQIGG